MARARPLSTECVDVRAALGRVLAEPIVSGREIPPWANSSMDGYAVRAADTRSAPVSLRVTGRIAAGGLPTAPVAAGEAGRRFSPAPPPPGAGAALPPRDGPAPPGPNTLKPPGGPG